MSDLPLPVTQAVRLHLLPYVDVEGKVARAVAELGGVADRDVVILDADSALRARELADLGARVVPLTSEAPSKTGLAPGSADAVIGFWTTLHPGADGEFAEAERILRPGGRLLAVHDYARDDVSAFFPEDRSRALVAMSRRGGWYLEHGFRIRVVHAYWTFPDTATMCSSVSAVFGARAAEPLADRRRARLSWKVVVYHRMTEGGDA